MYFLLRIQTRSSWNTFFPVSSIFFYYLSKLYANIFPFRSFSVDAIQYVCRVFVQIYPSIFRVCSISMRGWNRCHHRTILCSAAPSSIAVVAVADAAVDNTVTMVRMAMMAMRYLISYHYFGNTCMNCVPVFLFCFYFVSSPPFVL